MLCWNIGREIFLQERRHVCPAGARVCRFSYAIRIGAQWVVIQKSTRFSGAENMAL